MDEHPSKRAGATHRPAPLSVRLTGELESRFRQAAAIVRDVFYGLTGYEFERQAAHVRADLENLFIFMIMGDLIGVPILPPYYALRLVPYLVETIPAWRRRVLRERHTLEGEEFDLHGI